MTDILRLSVPLTAWLAAFSAIYGLQALVCSPHWTEAGIALASGRGALLLAWALAVALQIGLLLALRSPGFASPSRFVQRTSLTLAATALVATIWTLVPVAATSACVPH